MGAAFDSGDLFGMQHHAAAWLGFEVDEIYCLASLAKIPVGGTGSEPQPKCAGGDIPALPGSGATRLPARPLLLLLLG